MKKSTLVSSLIAFVVAFVVAFVISAGDTSASAHCQVPCGIYDDPMRITMLREDAVTIGKAVDSANELVKEGGTALDLNQIIRWTTVKDEAATNIQRIVSDYFLTQRVKAVAADDPGHAAYLDQLAKMHAILVAAMKCKQTVDPANVRVLSECIEAIAPMYPPPHDHG